jgi:hypothetical protein
MSARFFLDTDVLLYAFEQRLARKRESAKRLMQEALAEGRGIISFPVIQEFLNVATRKLARPLSNSDAELEGAADADACRSDQGVVEGVAPLSRVSGGLPPRRCAVQGGADRDDAPVSTPLTLPSSSGSGTFFGRLVPLIAQSTCE